MGVCVCVCVCGGSTLCVCVCVWRGYLLVETFFFFKIFYAQHTGRTINSTMPNGNIVYLAKKGQEILKLNRAYRQQIEWVNKV